MYGYLKVNEQDLDKEENLLFHCYYCSLCAALDRFYGVKSQLLLSYDATLAPIFFGLFQGQIHSCPCNLLHPDKKPKFPEEEWKIFAAYDLLLSEAKLQDDRWDEKSGKALVALAFFHHAFKKAGRDYPELHHAISLSFARLREGEKRKRDFRAMADLFAELMETSLALIRPYGERERLYLHYVAEWLYLIDAVDDYQKDYRKGRFNPFYPSDAGALAFSRLEGVLSYLAVLKKEGVGPSSSREESLLLALVNRTIPRVSREVIAHEAKAVRIRLRKGGKRHVLVLLPR